MRRYAVFVFIQISFFITCFSQYVQVGEGNYLGTAGGPFQASAGLSSYSTRFAYVFPRAVLGNIQHGDTLTSLEFMRTAGTGLNNSTNLKILLKNTSLTDFGAGILRWSLQTSGTTSVYDQNPSGDIGTGEGFHRIPFNNNFFVYDTTIGDNLMMLVEYSQTATQSNVINWYFENTGTVSGYSANQTKSVTGIGLKDSLASSSDYHPTIIFNYPRYDRDIAVLKVYTLGKLPVPLGNPDSVKVLVRNVGKKAQTGVNINTWLKGYNQDQDSVKVDLAVLENKFVNLPSLNPKNKGLDTVIAEVSGDANSLNNHGESYRLNSENVYSYRDVTLPPAGGGIGFNGQTGDFVARFFSNKTKSLNQVSVRFAFSGRPFKIGVWDNTGSGGKPGKLLYLSDSLTTVSGNYILDFKKPVSVNGTFFVGVRQLNTNNIAFGYQDESPVRPNTFFYTSPYGDTNWVDFHPDAPYKFMIEPRIQGDTDLTVLSADFPKDSIDRITTDTIAPKATIANIGATDLLDSFTVSCEIRYYGKLVYKNTVKDTMSSGGKRSYTFLKSFYPKDFGEHELIVYTYHPHDQIVDNDTARRKFYVGVKKDVMVATVYDPPNNAGYEYLRDTIFPTATIQNPGYDNSVSFVARCRIFKGTTVLYNQTQTLSLPKFNSKILSWLPYACKDTGKLRVVFTTEMAGDKYKLNDTIVRNVVVYKSYDLGVDSVAVPDKNKFYTPKTNYKPIVRLYNDGILEAVDAIVVCRITSVYTALVYRDTLTATVPAKGNYLAQFNRIFKPDRKGLYNIFIQVFYPEDRVRFNDSLKQNFSVGYPYDYYAKNVIYPISKDTLDVGSGPFAPKIKMGNSGYVKNSDVIPVICQIWHKGQRVYQDIKSLNLDTGMQFDLPFAAVFNPINAGKYQLMAYTNYVSDVYKKNDTVFSEFTVVIGRDAYIKSIELPVQKIYKARADSVKVQVVLANAGKLSIKPVRVYAEIYYKNKLVFFDKTDDSLLSLDERIVNIKNAFMPMDTGWYRLLTYNFSDQDQNMLNDSMSMWFRAEKSVDVLITQWTDPLPGSVIIHNSGNRKPGVVIAQTGTDTAISIGGKLYFGIYTQPGNSVVFYDSTTFTGLKGTGPLGVICGNYWDFNVPGFYKAMAVVKVPDRFAENDTLFSAFEVRLNSVKSLQKQQINLYPNPAQTTLGIEGNPKVREARAINALGQVIVLPELQKGVFDVSHLTPGLYTFVADTEKGQLSARFVRE